MSCAVYDGAGGPCPWCGWPPEDHELFWCPKCGGDRIVPDLTDRVSRSRSLPSWAWRQLPCQCTFDEFGLARRGGVVDRSGRPVSDETLDAKGIG